MRDFKRKNKFKKRLYSKPVLIILLIILILIARGAWSVRSKSQIGEEKRRQAEAVLMELESKESEAQESLARIQSDLGQEEELRHKYNVAKEGENIVIIVEPEEDEGEAEPEKQKGFWSKLFFWRD